MLDYKAYLVRIIEGRAYVLADVEERIDRLWLEGRLTEQEREELRDMAAQNAPESMQVDVAGKLADLEHRVWELEHPVDIYAIWEPGYQTQQHEIVRYDVTGDGELDLCQYNGGRAWTGLSIGKIEGWNMLDRELNITHVITQDAAGNFVLTPIEDVEPEALSETEPTIDQGA